MVSAFGIRALDLAAEVPWLPGSVFSWLLAGEGIWNGCAPLVAILAISFPALCLVDNIIRGRDCRIGLWTGAGL